MVDDFLKTYGKDTKFPDFPAYLSSVQTHLDVDLQTLPTAYTYFAKLDFVRAILFSNSPDFEPAKLTENAQIPSEASESANSGEIPEEKAQNQTNKNASLKKISASWGEVINRAIKDGELTVYFALKDTSALDGNGILTIKVQDEEKRATILTNKEKIIGKNEQADEFE